MSLIADCLIVVADTVDCSACSVGVLRRVR